uniref:Uncharacterized protein n=1 Tax=Octopus bimaculoides TaxID=37653 RepID=A0A0L8HLC5_OCTBM
MSTLLYTHFNGPVISIAATPIVNNEINHKSQKKNNNKPTITYINERSCLSKTVLSLCVAL